MSRTPRELEEFIARRFGYVNDQEGFTVAALEPYIEKMKQFDDEKRAQAERDEEAVLARRRKPTLVCPNPQCQNNHEERFEKDEKMGQITCQDCGTVVVERQIQDKEWVRKFEEDTVNPSFHGPAPDPKFSSYRNLQTGIAQDPRTKKQARELTLAQQEVEMNLSRNMDLRKEKTTRVGYKDKEKEAVFKIIDEISEAISLHDSITERGKTIFGRFRDDTKQLVDRDKVAAACLLLALRERLEAEGEVINGKPVEAMPEFKCKYCQFPFSLKRDKIMHQRKCDQRPKNDDKAGESSQTDDDGSNKRMKMS